MSGNQIEEGRVKEPKNINAIMWAYFSPNGYVQVRSIAETRKLSRENIGRYDPDKYKKYEDAGYVLRRVKVIITVQKTTNQQSK